jgi:hypothetical protein
MDTATKLRTVGMKLRPAATSYDAVATSFIPAVVRPHDGGMRPGGRVHEVSWIKE